MDTATLQAIGEAGTKIVRLEAENKRMRQALEWIKAIAELDDTTQLVELCTDALADEQIAPGKETP